LMIPQFCAVIILIN